ncbi:MAG: oxygenase MpaB family protein [Nitriliruptoraceae bacterium]
MTDERAPTPTDVQDRGAPLRGAQDRGTTLRGAQDRATDVGVPFARSMIRKVLTRLFGGPPFDPDADPGDPGLTGPGSPSWLVIGEPAAIAGGLRGLLVQVAHPLAMAGVHDHSAFREDPLGRLQRTSAYVTTTTFGSTREALQVSRRVRAVHPKVRGTAPDGRSYRADDPRLLTWVSIALTSSFLAGHRLWAPQVLSSTEEDAFVAQQSHIGALLDPRVDLEGLLRDAAAQAELRAGRVHLPMIADGTLPTSVAALEEVLASFHHDLGINHQGREALAFLRRPPIPLAARAGYRSLLTGALGSLEPQLQEALERRRPAWVSRAAVAQAGATLSTMRAMVGTSPSLRAAEQRATLNL